MRLISIIPLLELQNVGNRISFVKDNRCLVNQTVLADRKVPILGSVNWNEPSSLPASQSKINSSSGDTQLASCKVWGRSITGAIMALVSSSEKRLNGNTSHPGLWEGWRESVHQMSLAILATGPELFVL